jgi:hypothetical protein
MSTTSLWKRFQQHLSQVPALGLTLDVSRMRFEDGFLDRMANGRARSGGTDAPGQMTFCKP